MQLGKFHAAPLNAEIKANHSCTLNNLLALKFRAQAVFKLFENISPPLPGFLKM